MGSGTGTPVSTTGIVTRAQVVAHLKAQGISTPDTARVDTLILQAEQAIRDRCARRFTPGVVTASRTVLTFGGDVVYPDELVTVTSVTDSDGNAITGYETTPADDGFKLSLRLPGRYAEYVTVTGTWGWATFPEALVRGALIAVSVWYAGDYSSYTIADGENGYPRILSLPRDVLPLIDAYRIVRI